MGFFAWIITGLVAGALAKAVTGVERRGCIFTMLVGVVGAVIGGAVFNAFDEEGVGEFGWRSLLVAFVGATILLLGLRLLGYRGRRR